MTGVPASAAGGSSSARRTGPRGAPGAAHEPAERAIPGGAVERGPTERGRAGRGSTERGGKGRGGTGRGGAERGGTERGATEGGAAGRGGKITAAAVNQASVWNVANLLTMLRLLLVPAFVALMLGNGGYDPAWRSFAWASFAVAMITDLFDGHLARTYNLVTDFGKIADPIADKAIMGAALICLSALGDLPWWVTAVILGRELGITVLRFVVIRYGVIPASRGGKLKTLTQGIAVGMYVLALTGPLATLRFWVMAAAVVLTVVTGLDYVKQAIVLRRQGIAERKAALKGTEA
ncbi:CDP-diacylglycerol--glycerol-3-phosphate 3-phosphatidyltransferase [Streptomyces sp. AC512_CC834]|uniref:CDP-diacylglycerol--glycerol-3-phosphate 3-phosphatidyltransferase n=1 Tax=Streptomyces sp. AC512_CC834 TaxID=2823691 RepID=UPI001C2690B5|nr:CDP-diacylglycerol--glycerol-3-phosphate 3-phosphatidyltransferase [Streptomyces sp. AC512_CC834]